MADKFEQEEVKLDSKAQKLAFQTIGSEGLFSLPDEPVDLDVEEMIEMYQTDGKVAKIIDMPLRVALESIEDYTNIDQKYVEYVHEHIMSSPKYKTWLANILTSRWIGVSVSVVNLKKIKDKLVIDEIYTIDPTTYYDGGIGLKNIKCNTQSGEIILSRKNCILHTNEGLWGNPYGTSILKYIKRAYDNKREAVSAWRKFLRRFGLPIVVGRCASDAKTEEVTALADGIENLSYGASQVIKGGIDEKGNKLDTIDFVEAVKNTADFKEFIKEQDREIVTSLGGSSILFNTEENGSYSLGAIHLKIFLMTVDMIKNQIQDIFCGKIVAPMLRANFGEDVTSFGSIVFRKYEGREFKEVAQGYAELVKNGILDKDEPHIRKDLAQPLKSGTYNYNDADAGQISQKKGGTNGDESDRQVQTTTNDEETSNSTDRKV
ncbi:MAG: DUF935 family protein [Methanogenium sp.]|jgi:phage gp29-like protein